MYTWKPISPLSDAERSIDLSMRPLYDSWRTQKERLKVDSPMRLDEFNQRLVRRLSVETGILERIYDLDRGTTEALVANGFREELVSRSSTDIEPARLIDILRDQESGIQLVMDCVAGNRKLTKSVMHELHTTLLRHQETTTAIDQFGTRREIPLRKGRFKEHPNNPKRPDNTIHEYCPPIHVEAEVDNLLNWLDQYESDDPILVAAWVHHRFTQIHPYQDGNGRLARALTTLVLLRADLLPLVVDRDLRVAYIDSLERADGGNLEDLAKIFARLERSAILQALSVDVDTDISQQHSLASAVLQSLKNKFEKRRVEKDKELRHVNEVAIALRSHAVQLLNATIQELKGVIPHITEAQVIEGGTDKGSGHWYRYEVGQSASNAKKYANFTENHYFTRLAIRSERERLIFVISLHHVGRELSGVMEATAFAQLQSFEQSDEWKQISHDFSLCSPEPFVFTYETKLEAVTDLFAKLLDVALAVAVKEFGDRL